MIQCTSSTSTSAQPSIQLYNSPLELYDDVSPYFKQREAEANIMFPQLIKLRQQKLGNAPSSSSYSSSSMPDFWLVLRVGGMVQFVLSCTNGPLGTYPVFIWSSTSVTPLSTSFVNQTMELLAQELSRELPEKMARRVYSVFAPSRLTFAFISSWSRITGKLPIEDPYYDATFASVSRTTLLLADKVPREPLYPFELRQAGPADVEGVAKLCFEFAATSDPFLLDMDQAMKESRWLISQGLTHVCEVQGRIVCMVAVTRSSGSVAAITKVVTNSAYGGQGWAKRLVRHVCQKLLWNENKRQVVLYVARGNGSAESAYHSVGFGGLRGSEPDPEVDADWIEIGLEDTDLGHW